MLLESQRWRGWIACETTNKQGAGRKPWYQQTSCAQRVRETAYLELAGNSLGAWAQLFGRQE